MITPGRYLCKATKVRIVGEPGKEQIGVRLLLKANGSEVPMIWYAGLLPSSYEKVVVRGLRALGWKGDDVFDLEGDDVDISKLLPEEGEAVVEEEEYRGEKKLRVKFINSAGIGGKALDARAKEQLRARLRAQSGGANGGAPAAPAWDGTGADPFGGDGDDPFNGL